MADLPNVCIEHDVDFLNHVKRVLDSGPQQWEFRSIPYIRNRELLLDVAFLGSGRSGRISYSDNRGWAYSDDSAGGPDALLSGRLNGKVRDPAGNMVDREFSPSAKGDGE